MNTTDPKACTWKTYFQQYNDFADACDIPVGDINGAPNISAVRLARSLVEEEWEKETEEALAKYLAHPSMENLAELADGIVDSVYVLLQLARALGIPFDEHWTAVHEANMSKVMHTGKVLKREDGKVLKPYGWKAPNHWEILKQFSDWKAFQEGKLGASNWTLKDFDKKREV